MELMIFFSVRNDGAIDFGMIKMSQDGNLEVENNALIKGNLGIGIECAVENLNYKLQVGHNGTADDLVVDTNGSVGMGTNNPERWPLTIRAKNNSEELICFEEPDGTKKWHINQNLSGNKPGLNFVETGIKDGRIFIKPGRYVGIFTTEPNYELDVAGNIHATNFYSTSDVRFKSDIKQLTNVLKKVEQIRGVSFEWNDLYKSLGRSTRRREIGIIAQEVESVFPELVTNWGDEGYKAIDYSRMMGVIIEAVKALKIEINELNKKIADLK